MPLLVNYVQYKFVIPYYNDIIILGALEYLYRRYTGKVIDVSRLFIDFNARLSNLNWSAQQHFVINRDAPGDSFGTNRQAAIRAVQQYGFCAESLWPYSEDLYMRNPPQEVYDEAARVSIVPVKVPINIVSVKTCLAHQIPVLIGIELRSDEAYNNRGFVHIPKTPPNEGFHACLVVGYDDRIQHFIIRNSWGTDWVCKIYLF
jgi:C1A family cysteine protease